MFVIFVVKEKEPLPQSVEVLSHAAARAATFLVLAAMWTASQAATVLGCSVNVCFNLVQSYRPRLSIFSISLRFHSILCFQSYIATWATSEFQSYAAFIGCI